MNCATCGRPLSENFAPLTEWLCTIKDNEGEHHGACWGKPKRDRIAVLEAAVLAAKVLLEPTNETTEPAWQVLDDAYHSER